MAIEEATRPVNHETHVGIDTMSNISTVTPSVARSLNMKLEKTAKPIYFGSATHGGLVEIRHVATSTASPYLGSLVVTPEGKSSLIAAYWFSQMGYDFTLYASGEGFSLVNSVTREVIYRGKIHTDLFPYVTWSLVENLKPANSTAGGRELASETYRQANSIYYIQQVCDELDYMEETEKSRYQPMQSNSTRAKNAHISEEFIHLCHENHSKAGHQSPRAMAELLHMQATSDFPPYTSVQLLKVFDRWPCLFCKGAAMRRGTKNVGSGVKLSPAEAGAIWSLDTKGTYTPAYSPFGHTAIHLLECLATGMTFHRGFKAPSNSNELSKTVNALCIFMHSKGKKVKELRTDAGSPEKSEEFRVICANKYDIEVNPVPPKAQHMNPVERLIETVDNKVDAIIAEALQGSSLTDAIWYSAYVIALRSLDTQIRPGYHPTKTPYEQIHGRPPNMGQLFPYRLAQLVTVTGLTEKQLKTDHHMAGVVCYTLHSDGRQGTWCYCPHPDVDKAYLRDHTNIQRVDFKDIPNRHTTHYLPNQSTHPTYPASSILRFIDKHIDTQSTPTIPRLGEDDMQVETEIPTVIQAPTSTTNEARAPTKDSLNAPQMEDKQASIDEPDQQEDHHIGIDPYIGKKVRKKFPNRKWYEGTIDFSWKDDDTLLYRIKYDDGQCEDLTAHKVALIVDNRPPLVQNSTILMDDQSDTTDHADDNLEDYYFPQCNSTRFDYPYLLNHDAEDEEGNIYTINSTVSSTARPTEYPIHVALKKDRVRWEGKVINLMNEHTNVLHSLKMVSERDIPHNAVIIPGTMICKEDKVDTSMQGEHLMDSIRLVAQDTRSEHEPSLVYATVASSKAIKLVFAIATWNWLKIGMVDIVKAFPSTPLPQELEGMIFLKLSKSIMDVMNYETDQLALAQTAIEGMKRSNKIYEINFREAIEKEGFVCCPNEEQIISYRTSDGHFFLGAKVVDNIVYAATHKGLEDKFIAAIEKAKYRVKTEADNKFIGMQIEELGGEHGILVHQERQILKIGVKYNIPLTAHKGTPLPGTFSQTNYVLSKESPACDIKLFQRGMGDLLYINLTNCATPFASSALARKTQYCSERDMEAILHVFEYLMSHRKQGLHFRRAPPGKKPRDVRDILRMPIQNLISYDGAHNPRTADLNPYDQIAYVSKLYAEYNGAIKVASQTQHIGLSSTEAEVAALVKAVRCALDTYFILNHIGFRNISKIIASGDNISCKTLCTESSPTQKRSKHFNMNAVWVRQFHDEDILQLVYTPTKQLTSNALTKRVTEQEQTWSTDHIRGASHHPSVMSIMEPEPIKASSHHKLWPVVPCSSSTP